MITRYHTLETQLPFYFVSCYISYKLMTSHFNSKPFPSTHGQQLLAASNTKSSHPPADSQQLLPSSPGSTTATIMYDNSRTNSTFNQTQSGGHYISRNCCPSGKKLGLFCNYMSFLPLEIKLRSV